jgi:amidohydrolase
VRLIFQPHEEVYPGGAPDMIAGGALDGVSSVFGIHISSTLPTGQIGTRPGAFMAATNPLSITISGRGGHAAMPNQCIDPVVGAAHVITALQSIISRNVAITDPAVVSITQIIAGTADNIIPNEVLLRGTVRTFDAGVRTRVCERVREIAAGIAASLGCAADIHLDDGYPVLVNHADVVQRAFDAARTIGFDEKQLLTIPPIGGAEDFAYYCERVPGAFVFLGASNDAKQCSYPHHHPKFNVDEDALACGAALYAQYAIGAAPI